MTVQRHPYVVILAGGKGERLWPLSREKKPKQLLPLIGSKTLIELTIDRVNQLAARDTLWIMTTQQYEQEIKKLTHTSVGHIITEPATRNTAPAMLLTCLEIAHIDSDAPIMFLPADHFIPDGQALRTALTHAAQHAMQHKSIVLLGNKPTFPATGYGYIEYDAASECDGIFSIQTFHEKPDAQTAQRYVASNRMLWNGGMFVGTAATFIAEFKKHAPQLYQEVCRFKEGKIDYAHITAISIDHAIMERSDNIAVLPVDFAWSDIGNLSIFVQLQQMLLEKQITTVVPYKSSNNLVLSSKKIVALIGVDDLCIVETDDVLLIGKQTEIEQVKQVVQRLKEDGNISYL